MNNISSTHARPSTKSIGLREFRENTEKVVKSLKKGGSLTVYKRSKPFFTITTPVVDEWGDEGNWVDIGFEEAFPDGVEVGEFLRLMKEFEAKEAKKRGR